MSNQERYGPLPKDANPLRRRCRLLQSWYRVEVLGITECGSWRRGGGPVGSSLRDGERSGANFISPTAFAYAQERVADKLGNRDLTIDEFRLFNNMLSSMPMCFNLFADLRAAVRQGSLNATAILRAVFAASPISTVEEVVVEMIPTPTADYTDDKTAFDAAILFTDDTGRPGLASIETKYTDTLGINPASKQKRKFALAKRLCLFRDEGLCHYESRGFDQVARNLLLTFAYADRRQLASATNYVLAPQDDEEAPRAVTALQSRLAPQYRDRIVYLPLEAVVERGLTRAEGDLHNHLERFRCRYLDFGQIAHL